VVDILDQYKCGVAVDAIEGAKPIRPELTLSIEILINWG